MIKLKGHTKIELKDVETGEVKVYEDDNMFTNAIGKMVDFIAKHNGLNALNLFTTHFNLLGGLVLYDSTITESADQVWLPSGVSPVGYGIVGDTNSFSGITQWGIYNAQESDTSAATTKKMVWDFITSHGNGTIAAIGLTHYNAGNMGLGIETWGNTARQYGTNIGAGNAFVSSSKGKQGRNVNNVGSVGASLATGGTYMNFCVDADNNLKYMFKVCADGISVISHSMSPEKFDVFRSSVTWQDYTEETYSETFSGGSYFYHFYNTDERCLYFWLGDDNNKWTNGADVYVHKFDCANKVLTKNWKRFQVASGVVGRNFVVTDDAIYFQHNENSERKIDRWDTTSGTVTNITSVSNVDDYQMYGRRQYILNGRIYWHYWSANGGDLSWNIRLYMGIIDTSNDTFQYTNIGYYNVSSTASNFNIVPPMLNTQMIFLLNSNAGENEGSMMNLQESGTYGNRNDLGNAFVPCHYLGTINNLSEPIDKTAMQTMKVTYTITAVELE